MKKVAILALALALAWPAAAEEKKAGGKPGTNIDMPYLMAPLTDADGKLTGYAYIASRLTAASEGIVTDVREKLPFIQDTFVRDVNATPVAPTSDPQAVDIPGIEARLKADAAKVMGPGKVKMLVVCTIQIAPLHPSQVSTPPKGDKSAKAPPSRCTPA